MLGVVVAAGGVAAWAVSAASRRARIAMAVRAQAEGGGQARIRLTVLAVTALALLASQLGLEAVLGAFLAGGLARLIDPDPEATHPAYPVKLDAIGFGFLVPVFFVTSGLKLDLRGVLADPSALVLVPLVFGLLLAVRGLPALAFRPALGGAGHAGQRAAAGDLVAVPADRGGDRSVDRGADAEPGRRAGPGWSVFRHPAPSRRSGSGRYGAQVDTGDPQDQATARADVAAVSGWPDALVVARLRERDEETFHALVRAWSPMMLRVAGGYVGSTATAEEVVQETWLAVVRGVDKFEGRSSLRTWVLRICVNQAKRHGLRESRIQPVRDADGRRRRHSGPDRGSGRPASSGRATGRPTGSPPTGGRRRGS